MANYIKKDTGLQVKMLRRSKKQSLTLAYVLYLQGLEADNAQMMVRSTRVRDCSTYWQGFKCPQCGRLHGMTTYGCHHRLCPICSVRKSRATAAQAMQVINQVQRECIEQQTSYDYSLLTLTQRNVPAEELNAEITRMLNAWSSLRYLRQVRRELIGWARTIEITVGQNGTYHPHIHCILITKQGSELTTTNAWRRIWREAMSLDYQPICDCRAITEVNAVYEVSKYVTKLAKIFEQPLGYVYDDVKVIGDATYKRRLRSYGGRWAAIRREMKMVDVEEMDDGVLNATAALLDGHDRCECGHELEPVCLIWSGMDYKEV